MGRRRNVISYNYSTGEFDSGATNLDIGGIDFMGRIRNSTCLKQCRDRN